MVEIINAANAGEIRGMYIQGENPAMSDPDLDHARAGLAKLEHLVVQDIFLTETAMIADVMLPSSAWPEKSGTVTNTNRQVQMGRKALDPARRHAPGSVDHGRAGKAVSALTWTYTHPSEVFAEMKLAMPSLDNITWERLERESSVIYPCPAPDQPGEAVVFGDGFPTQTGRARLVPADVLPPAEVPDRRLSLGVDDRSPARALAYGRHDASRRGARPARAWTDREPQPHRRSPAMASRPAKASR